MISSGMDPPEGSPQTADPGRDPLPFLRDAQLPLILDPQNSSKENPRRKPSSRIISTRRKGRRRNNLYEQREASNGRTSKLFPPGATGNDGGIFLPPGSLWKLQPESCFFLESPPGNSPQLPSWSSKISGGLPASALKK